LIGTILVRCQID